MILFNKEDDYNSYNTYKQVGVSYGIRDTIT